MNIYEIFIIGVGLAMDAFAVSVCKGLSGFKFEFKKGLVVALYFGLFQGIMPLLGFLLGVSFEQFIVGIDHWIAFILLFMIGFNMIKESFSKEGTYMDGCVCFFHMFPLAIATSIDALTVGIMLAFLRVNIIFSITIISIVTFILTFIGYKLGNVFGNKYEKKAQLLGGFILIFMGFKILIEHLLF